MAPICNIQPWTTYDLSLDHEPGKAVDVHVKFIKHELGLYAD